MDSRIPKSSSLPMLVAGCLLFGTVGAELSVFRSCLLG
jgi:hypothetical protein